MYVRILLWQVLGGGDDPSQRPCYSIWGHPCTAALRYVALVAHLCARGAHHSAVLLYVLYVTGFFGLLAAALQMLLADKQGNVGKRVI